MPKNIATLSNCLAAINPEIAKQWHPTKNFPLTPRNVLCGSRKKIWWKCNVAEDHEWNAAINSRTKGTGCPYCSGLSVALSNCLATTHPEIAKQWHPTKNTLTPYEIVAGSSKKVWWKCDVASDHEWETSPNNRSWGRGCPCCSGHKLVMSNCLMIVYPEIAKQWHPTKNLPLTPFDVTSFSGKKVWWQCGIKDHEWQTLISNRSNGRGCPYCTGQKASDSNCLAIRHPEISKQWHYAKNFPFTPYDVTYGSGKKFWWICGMCSYEWICAISHRSRYSCPLCHKSNGEKKIKDILENMNICYEFQKKFNKCKDIRKLRFDFYLPQYNTLIEYDGKQHFKPIKYFGGISTYERIKEKDEIKNRFAIQNNIPLLRIPYTKFDCIESEIRFFIDSLPSIKQGNNG